VNSSASRASVIRNAESHVVGALALYPDRIPEVAGFLSPENFRDARLAGVYGALLALDRSGTPIDFLSLGAHLEAQAGLLRPEGDWSSYLVEFSDGITSSAHLLHHARTVETASRVRNGEEILGSGLKELGEFPLGTPADPSELLDGLAQQILDVGERHAQGQALIVSAGDLALAVLAQLDETGLGVGLPTGLQDLDRLLVGMQPGELGILGARPSRGKTALALQIALNAARGGSSVLFVSLEMSGDQLAQRLLANLARVDSKALRRKEAKEYERERLQGARQELAGLPLRIVDGTHDLTLDRLRGLARRQTRRPGLDLLVLDYLQLLRAPKTESRWQEVAAVSRGLKLLARELRIPVLACAQLGRQADREDRPRLWHLREAGDIEQDADFVVLLHSDDPPAPLQCNVAKNRSGEVGEAILKFNRPHCRIADLESSSLAPTMTQELSN